MSLMLNLFGSLITLIMVLIGVAFITLLERKVLGLIQLRPGPNKPGIGGLFQPLSDAVKLFSKSLSGLSMISEFEYLLMPLGMVGIMLFIWMINPLNGFNIYFNGVLLIICILSLGVYPIMFGGWFSGSYYSMIGAIRSIAQMISFEVSFILIILIYLYIRGSLLIMSSVWILSSLFMFIPLLLLFISMLIELNRSPSDLVEGESELVSGFNTEYWGLSFSLIFMGEYGMIMFMGGLFSSLILGVSFFSLWWVILSVLFSVLVIIIRGALPRIRYDHLMEFCWVNVLISSMGFVNLMLGLEMYFSYF